MPRPMPTAWMRNTICPELATAEMAASLAKLPTAHRSTRVYRDWSRLAPMIGRANSSSWRTSGPWVRSRIVLDLACSSIKNLPYHRKVM